jgi:hypothetical protein
MKAKLLVLCLLATSPSWADPLELRPQSIEDLSAILNLVDRGPASDSDKVIELDSFSLAAQTSALDGRMGDLNYAKHLREVQERAKLILRSSESSDDLPKEKNPGI